MDETAGVLITSSNPRSIAAVEIAATAGTWERLSSDGIEAWRVPSQTDKRLSYVVTTSSCTCQDFTRAARSGIPHACKHVLAVRLFCELVKASTAKPARRGHLRVVA